MLLQQAGGRDMQGATGPFRDLYKRQGGLA